MHLKTLGELTLQGSDFKQSKPLLLLAYLCLEGAQVRRYLAELFWPRSSHAVRNLTTVLSRLNKVDADLVEVEGHKLITHLACDARVLLNAYEHQDYPEVIKHYQGRFLDGFNLKDMGTELEEWLYETREALATKVRSSKLTLAEQSAKEGSFLEAARQAEQAYLQAGASEPDEVTLERIYMLLVAGRDTLANDVKQEAQAYGLELFMTQEAAQKHFRETITSVPQLREGLTAKAKPHNLPKQATPFVGRQQALQHLDEQLSKSDCVLLSLVGPGGMGKTRLALALAEQQAYEGRFEVGVTFVSFVSVPTLEGMIPAMGDALGFSFSGQSKPKDQLFAFLEHKNILLLLDNLEHLLDGVNLLAELLVHAPNIKLLVTSREPLHLRAEHVFEVPGLTIPGEASDLENYDGVELFVQQAQRQQTTFTLDNENKLEVIKICQLLGGMPLALELAASWLKVLTLAEIAAEISRDLDFLEASSRDTPQRHRSIRAVFDYSWELLNPQEQAALRNLAVFKGGFTREAAREVAGVTLLELASLIDRSFINTTNHGRYRRHPLVIQYAQEKLAERGDSATVHNQHAQYYLDLAKEAKPHLRGEKQVLWFNTLAVEHENLIAALRYLVTQDYVAMALRLAVDLSRYWGVRGHYDQGISWLCDLKKQLPADQQIDLKAEALFEEGSLTWRQGSYTKAKMLLDESLELYRELGDQQGIAYLLNSLGINALDQGNYADAAMLLEESLTLKREIGDQQGIAISLGNLGVVAHYQGYYAKAKTLYEQSLTLRRELGDQQGIAISLGNLGVVAHYQGYYDDAKILLEESLNLCRELGDQYGVAESLAGIARLLFTFDKHSQSITLFAASEALCKQLGLTLEPQVIVGIEQSLSQLREVIGEEHFDVLWDAGLKLSMDEAVELALTELRFVDT